MGPTPHISVNVAILDKKINVDGHFKNYVMVTTVLGLFLRQLQILLDFRIQKL